MYGHAHVFIGQIGLALYGLPSQGGKMDSPVVNEKRQAVPEWAKPQTPKDAPDPNMATERQYAFINTLIEEKDLSKLSDEQQAFLAQDDFAVSKGKASDIISTLVKLPRKPKDAYTGLEVKQLERFAVGVPAGRYAVEADSGELRFYKVWVSRDKTRLNVYVEHGPDESDLKYNQTVMVVLNKIKAAGVRQCAIRYGMEIGECSNCGRRLTNRISRELGIGPVCGGRMFGDDFKSEVKQARANIEARGEDPNEELE